MMKCPNCGTEANEEDKVCQFCQTSLEAENGKEMENGKEAENDKEAKQSPAPKGGKIAAIAVAAVAVVGIGAFGMMKLNEKDPKDIVIDAFKNVYAEDQTYPVEEIFGLSQFVENAAKSSEGGFTIKLDSCSDETVNNLAGSGLRIDQKSDNENLKASVDMTAIYNGMDLLTLNLYYGDDKLMAAVPELLDTVFVADLGDGLEERIASSPTIGPLLAEQDVDVEGLMDYFKDSMEKAQENGGTDPYDIKGLINRYKEGCKAQENFKAAMTVEKADKAEFQMDGKTVSCKGYQVHISKDSMIEFLRTSSDFFLQDEELKQSYLENLEAGTKMMALLGTDYQGMSAKEMQEQAYEVVSEQVQTVITELDKSLQDMDMTVYVDSKGRLAAVSGSTAVVPEGEEPVAVTFEAYLEGGAYLTQNARASVTVDAEEEPVTIQLEKSGSWDGKQLTAAYEIQVQDAAVSFDGQYEVESGDFQLNAEIQTDGETQVKAAALGVVDELEKGSAVHISVDELSIEAAPVDAELTLSGEYYLRPLSGEITELEGEQMDVFAADENDWQSIMLQVYFSAMGLATKLGIQ